MDHNYSVEGVAGRRIFVAALCLLALAAIAAMIFFATRGSIDVFSPVGTIGKQQRNLIILACALSLIVVIPVFAMTFLIAWRYRATNTRARYTPEWDHHRGLESIWWGIPILLISVLAVVAWQSSHTLDPSRAIAAGKPVTVQVIALQWRWLFLYPEQGVASLNYVQFPVNTPVHFEITADAPMNSFWIPKLGGQIYAMAGMSTNLNLIANKTGDYRGSSANLSGSGFSGMNFTARASTDAEYQQWLKNAKQQTPLTQDIYAKLAQPTSGSKEATYRLADAALYDTVVHSYMHSDGGNE